VVPNNSNPAQNASQALGAFVARASWENVPASVRHAAKRAILNGVGAALGAASDPMLATTIALLQPFAGPAQAIVIGRSERLDLLNASFVNAVAVNAFDFDDTHLRTVIHPTAPVAPPALALAEQRGRSGAELLHAFVLGVEVACRLGNAVSPGHYARGWHITTTCGVLGAAAAAAKLIGLDGGTTAHAFGIAASQSGGIVENLAAGAKNIAMGNAARNGLLAALAAQRGCNAAPKAIEGPLGWARAAGDEADLHELLGGLGERWELPHNAFKPYPCGVVLHAVIDACLTLRQRHALAAADVASVVVSGHPLLLARGDRRVDNARDAKISIHHSVAVVLLFGAAGLNEYSDAVVNDPGVAALRARVRDEVDAAMPVGAARVRVTTRGGDTFEAEDRKSVV
jgi:2-methylcitrate dehydratase PrpD